MCFFAKWLVESNEKFEAQKYIFLFRIRIRVAKVMMNAKTQIRYQHRNVTPVMQTTVFIRRFKFKAQHPSSCSPTQKGAGGIRPRRPSVYAATPTTCHTYCTHVAEAQLLK